MNPYDYKAMVGDEECPAEEWCDECDAPEDWCECEDYANDPADDRDQLTGDMFR
jgi:hypothetical protein